MSMDARLARLSPGLTARERGVLLLRAFRDRTPEDPSWLSKMPEIQRRDVNHYIDLMNGCNTYLPLFITMVEGGPPRCSCACRMMDLVAYGSALLKRLLSSAARTP